MERRALLAVAISVIILIVYQEVILKRYQPPPGAPSGTPTAREEAPTPEAAPPLAEVPLRAPEAPKEMASPSAPLAPKVTIEGRDVIVETDLYRAVFTTAGARLKSFLLKKYRTTVAPNSSLLDLVGKLAADELPLGLVLRGPDKQIRDGSVAYAVQPSGLQLHAKDKGTLTFTANVGGARITKRFEMQGDKYFFSLDLQAEAVPPEYTELAIEWWKRHPPASDKSSEVVFDSVVALEAGKLLHEKFSALSDGKILEKDISWVAYSGKYFLAAMVPESSQGVPVTLKDLRVWLKERDDTVETAILLPPGRFNSLFDLYLGPKELDRLSGNTLRRAVDLGWFSFIALPMLQMLRLSHTVTGNYGIDIILLTVLIKILFFPLTQKSFKSMKEMQKLQPQMTKIREQLKDKPEEMNKEIMELYRRHKVNPLGGCLPMLLQMPVFIGLYEALLNSVELRHAPFVGWINDLSAPDRLGMIQIPFVHPPGFPVLTLLMGASMMVQQWMTPATSADPMQQRMMMLMPVVFTFMFINFPSGLTLYWLVNNILTIGQQYLINRPAASR